MKFTINDKEYSCPINFGDYYFSPTSRGIKRHTFDNPTVSKIIDVCDNFGTKYFIKASDVIGSDIHQKFLSALKED